MMKKILLLFVLLFFVVPVQVLALPFNPTQLPGLVSWYDASSPSANLVDGHNVGTWTDLSGQSQNLQNSLGTGRPVYHANLLNGLGGITFSNSWLQTIDVNWSKYIYGTAGYTLFILSNSVNDTQVGDVFSTGTNESSTGRWEVFLPNTNNLVWWNFSSLSAYNFSVSTSVYTSVGPHIYSFVAPTGSGTLDYDGTQALTKTVPTPFSNPNCPLIIGGSQSGNCGIAFPNIMFYQGNIHEIIFYDKALTQAQYQMVEGYLACKWGLQGDLPMSHPYSTTCPVSLSGSYGPIGSW